MTEKTHRVGVVGYIFKEDKMLFLSRNKEPKVWAPLGGHLHPDEDPVQGLLREIHEEAKISVKVLTPIEVTFTKDHKQEDYIGIYYLCEYEDGEILESDESSGTDWLTLEEIKQKHATGAVYGELKQYEKAFTLFNRIRDSIY